MINKLIISFSCVHNFIHYSAEHLEAKQTIDTLFFIAKFRYHGIDNYISFSCVNNYIHYSSEQQEGKSTIDIMA